MGLGCFPPLAPCWCSDQVLEWVGGWKAERRVECDLWLGMQSGKPEGWEEAVPKDYVSYFHSFCRFPCLCSACLGGFLTLHAASQNPPDGLLVHFAIWNENCPSVTVIDWKPALTGSARDIIIALCHADKQVDNHPLTPKRRTTTPSNPNPPKRQTTIIIIQTTYQHKIMIHENGPRRQFSHLSSLMASPWSMNSSLTNLLSQLTNARQIFEHSNASAWLFKSLRLTVLYTLWSYLQRLVFVSQAIWWFTSQFLRTLEIFEFN